MQHFLPCIGDVATKKVPCRENAFIVSKLRVSGHCTVYVGASINRLDGRVVQYFDNYLRHMRRAPFQARANNANEVVHCLDLQNGECTKGGALDRAR